VDPAFDTLQEEVSPGSLPPVSRHPRSLRGGRYRPRSA
jgi:hypothetical protein